MEEKKIIVDEAWDKLYQRIEQNGLLSNEPHEKTTNRKRRLTWWTAAAAIAACVGLAIAFFVTQPNHTKLLAIYNEEGAPTIYTTLEDGSAVFLGEQTTLQYPRHFAKDKREVSLSGNAYFNVSKREQCPFLIDTELAKVEVIGTTFSIESHESHSFYMAVKSGKVKVIRKSDEQLLLIEAGESVFLNANSFYKTASADSNPFDKQLGRIHFKDQRLADVASAINELSDTVQLSVAPSIENKLITASFSDESVYSMANIICSAFDLRYTIQDNVITISSKD